MSVKLRSVIKFLEKGIDEKDYTDIECECGYFLGYANKNDLKPTGEPMFKCPICLSRFDVIKNWFQRGFNMQRMKGKDMIDYLLEQQQVTLWMDNRNITDLAEFDLFTWYEIEHKGNQILITPVEFK